MSKELWDAVAAVFDEFGVSYEKHHGGKHPAFVYRAIDGSERKKTVPFSESDWRAIRNAVAEAKRDLVAAGYGSREIAGRTERLIDLTDGRATCSSLDIAEKFGKAHKDVLRSIDRVRDEVGAEFDQRNFAPMSYHDKSGREYRAYSMTRDGFSLVAMGFTGADASRWKVRYIDAFNAMEAQIAARQDNSATDALIADLEALTDIVLSLPPPVSAIKPRGPFINPVFIIRQRREERRARRLSS